MKDEEVIIRNAIFTPDGTYLRSYNRHDYKSHLDTVSGETYVVDGGNEYLRRSVNKVPAEELNVYLSDSFELVRCAFVWKSYGINHEHLPDGIYISLRDISTPHINAILATQQQIVGTFVERLMIAELAYRREKLNE